MKNISQRDAESLLPRILPRLRVVRGPDERGEYVAWCEFHLDGKGTPPHQPNLNVSERGFICHACGESGGLHRLAEKLGIELQSNAPDEIAFNYQDEDSTLLYQVVRLPGKKFRQRRPDGSGGWTWKLGEVRRVLYHLHDLVKRTEERVWIVEGEKDADRLASLGLLATTNAGGAGKWRPDYSETLADRDVVIVPDNDDPGHQHAEKVARSLKDKAASVKILKLPELEPKGDVSDWMDVGGTVEQLISLAEATPKWEADNSTIRDAKKEIDNSGKESMAVSIINIVEEEGVELFHDERPEPFARVSLREGRKIMALSSKNFDRWLSQLIWTRLGKVPGSEALKSAKNALAGKACHDGPQHRLSVRVARQNDAIWIDLDGVKAVKVTTEGWEVVDEPPILFRPQSSTKPLPLPESKGDPFKLLDFTNISNDNTAFLLMCYLVAAIVPDIAVPALIVHGVQGAAKTTLLRLIRRLIDPSRIETSGSVKDEQEFALSAWQNRCLFFDNLTGIPVWLSNAICRAVTGDGWSTRTLYSNEDITIFEFQRIIGLAGINQVAQNADLLDRSVIIELDPIPLAARRPEGEFWGEFEHASPAILGGLLDALVVAMQAVDKLEHDELPRMADFARWGAAAAVGLEKDPDDFRQAYDENISRQSVAAIEASPVAETVVAFMEDRNDWVGSVSELYGSLKGVADGMEISTKARSWPASPSALSRKLKEAEPPLRGLGIEILRPGRTATARKVCLRRILHDHQDDIPANAKASLTAMTAYDGIENNTVTTHASDIANESGCSDGNDGISPTSVFRKRLPANPQAWPDDALVLLETEKERLIREGEDPFSARRVAKEEILRRNRIALEQRLDSRDDSTILSDSDEGVQDAEEDREHGGETSGAHS